MTGRCRPTLDAWEDAWNAWARCTAPADLDQARWGISKLYELHGADMPTLKLVLSPQVGDVLADAASGQRSRARIPDLGRTGLIPHGTSRAVLDPLKTTPPNPSRAWMRVRLDELDELGAGHWRSFGIHWAVATVVAGAFSGWRAGSMAPDTFRVLNLPAKETRLDALDEHALVDAAARVFGEEWTESASWIGARPAARILVAGTYKDLTYRAKDYGSTSYYRPLHVQAGQFDAIHPYLMAWSEVYGRRLSREKRAILEARLAIARSCGPWWQTPKQILVSDRPQYISLDEVGRPHADTGPAIVYRDGWSIFASHGQTTASRLLSDAEHVAVGRQPVTSAPHPSA